MDFSRFIIQGFNDDELSNTIQNFLLAQGLDINKLQNPPIDILENEECISIFIDIPGVKSTDIDLDFLNNKLDIFYSRK